MITAEKLREAIRLSEIATDSWTLIVIHDNGTPEAAGMGADELIGLPVEELRRQLGEWLLTEEPVPCDVALAAGVGIFDVCDRCEDMHPHID